MISQFRSPYLERTDANYQQLAFGMAWFYRQYAQELSPDDQVRFDAAETTAKQAKLGLWADAEPMPPWNWRHKK